LKKNEIQTKIVANWDNLNGFVGSKDGNKFMQFV
jgi:hypothetical protein